MLRHTIVGLLLVLFAGSPGLAQDETDVKGSLDHPLFTRMPGYYISDYDVKEFDKYTSPYATGQDENWEGKVTRSGILYQDRRETGEHVADCAQLRECREENRRKDPGERRPGD